MTVAQQINLAGAQQHALPFQRELYVDLFAGAGGASSGGARVYRDPDVAINHNPIAIAVHRANHRNTRHYISDIYEVDPLQATGGQPVGILWASPDCRHFSKAKGGAPRSKSVRSLPWVVVRWVYATRPRLFLMENVEEFQAWGPLDDQGKPTPVPPLEPRTPDEHRRFEAACTRRQLRQELARRFEATHGAHAGPLAD